MSLTTIAMLRGGIMRQGARLLVAGVFVFGAMGAAWAGASAHYALTPQVVASGGAAAASAHYAITATVGQPAAGPGASAHYTLCSGFWCGAVQALERLFLPLVQRS